jgi:3-oxoacyl-[acyl-carrier protein] reductase
MTDLNGKVALVTGSARGIGKAIALRYASLGANIVVNYARDDTAAKETVAAIEAAGAQAIAVRCDVSVVADLDALYKAAIDRFGRLDIVVANAGVEIVNQPIAEVTEDDYDRLFAINTKGAFFTIQKAAQHVADGGRIIYIGSTTTHSAFPGAGLYGCSKMAPQYLFDFLAMELGTRRVTVNSIEPTAIDGAGVFTHALDNDPLRQQIAATRPIDNRLGTPEDVADAAEYFASPLAAWVSGQHLLITGGATQ